MIYTIEEIDERQNIQKKRNKKIRILVYIILIPILFYNIILLAQSAIEPSETPNFLGVKSYVIISGSMQPELNIGDIVFVKKEMDLHEGDIISFRQGQSVITHRINKVIDEDGKIVYQTKGDNNNIEDSGTITAETIEGKVIWKLPKLGNVSLFLQNKMIIIFITLLLYMYISISGSREKKRKERKRIRKQYEKMEEKNAQN